MYVFVLSSLFLWRKLIKRSKHACFEKKIVWWTGFIATSLNKLIFGVTNCMRKMIVANSFIDEEPWRTLVNAITQL